MALKIYPINPGHWSLVAGFWKLRISERQPVARNQLPGTSDQRPETSDQQQVI